MAGLDDEARRRPIIESGRQAVAEWQSQHGALTFEERASAEALLDSLLAAAGRRGA